MRFQIGDTVRDKISRDKSFVYWQGLAIDYLGKTYPGIKVVKREKDLRYYAKVVTMGGESGEKYYLTTNMLLTERLR
jgi:hypothetical protein